MSERFREIIEAYSDGFRTHGDSPAALLGAKGRQHLRFQALVPFVRGQDVHSVLDYGCGLAHLVPYLRSINWKGEYYGVDIVEAFIQHARSQRHANAHFDHILPGAKITGRYDLVFASGVFNLQTHDSVDESREYALDTIRELFNLSNRFLVCDFMTDYVDFRQPGSQHWLPQQLIDFSVKELTRRFVVRHDLMPYEFTVMFYKDASIKRPENVYESASCL
ncbi:MAG TPA: class I SAM-dependent methyltransferase [Vicinamibacterales bacterium]|jgi:SAM-dependent methyltransferase